MSFLHQHRLQISTLAPVHIGSNETYEPTNYVIDDHSLYEFNTHEVMRALSKKDNDELLTIVSPKITGNGYHFPSERLLKQVQAFFYRHRAALIAQSKHSLPVGQGINRLYSSRIGQTAQFESQGKQVIHKLEIERTTYNPADRQPVFPGSSMKGAIRTALLDSVNKGKSLNPREKSLKPTQQNRALQERLFQYTMRDLQKDPMRLLHLADAHWQVNDIASSEVYFAVNRKKYPVMRDGRLLQSQGEKRGLYQLLECIPAQYYRCLSSTLNLHQVRHTPIRAKEKLPVDDLQWLMPAIAQACNAFYLPLLEKEIELLDHQHYANPVYLTHLKKIIQALKNDTSNKAFLLRLGRHSGADAVTLNGVRSIKIMGAQGNRPTDEPSAKTLWLASSETAAQRDMMPFGWVLVEINPEKEHPLRNILNASSSNGKKWWQEQQKKQQAQQQKFVALQRKREEEAAQQAEAKAKAEAEQREKERVAAAQKAALEQARHAEAERVAALSPEGQRIDTLEKAFKAYQQAGYTDQQTLVVTLRSQAKNIIKECAAWQADDKSAALDIAEAICNGISWGKNKKTKKKLLAQIKKL